MDVLVKDLASDKPLFRTLTLPVLEKLYREMSKDLGFPLVPHGLRHAGPSHDTLVHKMPLDDIRLRGRWVSIESCRIYTEPASLVRSLARVPDAQLVKARRLLRELPQRTVAVVSEALAVARRTESSGSVKRRRL